MESAPEPPTYAQTEAAAADRGTLARAAAGFKRGRGLTLAGLISALVLGVWGLWQLLSHDDEARVYGELGRKINGIRLQCFDAFWECALDGVDLRAVHNNAELTEWLRTLAAEVGPGDYAAHLREDCADKLEPIAPGLAQLIVPPDLQSDVASLQRAATELHAQLGGWLGCLDRADIGCDAPGLNGIARSWFEFQTAHAAVNRTLKLRLEKR